MKKITNVYGEKYLKFILNDQEKLEKIYDIAYQSREGINGANQEIENIRIAIDNYVMNQILSNSITNKELKNYSGAFNKTIRQDMTYIFRNPILKLPKDKLQPVMTTNIYNALQQRKNAIAKKSKEIYLKDKGRTTKEERELLLDYLAANIGTRDKEIIKMQEKMVREIIMENSNRGYKDVNFIVEFIAQEELKEYGIEGYCHLSQYEAGKSTELSKNKNGTSNSLRATINQEYGLRAINKKENIATFIYSVCHEVRHINQEYEISKGVKNKEVLNNLTDYILKSYLTETEYNYYKDNYYFESGEVDAEIDDYSRANKYLKKYATTTQIQELLEKRNNKIYEKITEIRKNKQQDLESADEFKYREIENIVKKYPEILTAYPQLQSIYIKEGKLKSLEQILIEKGSFIKKNKQDNANIYTSIINVLIDKNELEEIDFSVINKTNIYSIMHALSTQYDYYTTSSNSYISEKTRSDSYFYNNNIKDSDLIEDVKVMKSRLDKLENILDPLYDNFADQYRENNNYKQDAFIYQKNKLYARYRFHKIKSKTAQLNDIFNDQEISNEIRVKK